MEVRVTYHAGDEQAMEIRDLYHSENVLFRFSSLKDGQAHPEDEAEITNKDPAELRMVLVGGSLNGQKWWLSTPLVRWHDKGITVGFSDRHERAMNEASDEFVNMVAEFSFFPL
jgi:hypothetical protein